MARKPRDYHAEHLRRIARFEEKIGRRLRPGESRQAARGHRHGEHLARAVPVRDGRMAQEQADQEIAAMEAALATLEGMGLGLLAQVTKLRAALRTLVAVVEKADSDRGIDDDHHRAALEGARAALRTRTRK